MLSGFYRQVGCKVCVGWQAPVLTACTTLAVPPCAAVLQYSSHLCQEHCTPHAATWSQGCGLAPRCTSCACHLCHLLLPAASWPLLCPDQGALHDFASCSCGLSDPHLIWTVRALCKSRKISKIQSQPQTSFSPDVWALLVISLLFISMSPAPGSMFPPPPQRLHVTALQTGRSWSVQWLYATLVCATLVSATLVCATPPQVTGTLQFSWKQTPEIWPSCDGSAKVSVADDALTADVPDSFSSHPRTPGCA